MRNAYAGIITCFLILVFVQGVTALPGIPGGPTTVAATDVNSSALTFHATGAAGPTWWRFGIMSGNLPWVTENVTAADDGTANTTQMGVPLMSGTTFYYQVCDPIGCGGEMSATLTEAVPNPESTFGSVAHNISAQHLDASKMGGNLVEVYTWTTGTPLIVFGVLLFFVFTGLWLRQREVVLPIMVGLLGSGLLIYEGTNSVGIPPEFLIIAIGLVALGLTGVVTGLFKR